MKNENLLSRSNFIVICVMGKILSGYFCFCVLEICTVITHCFTRARLQRIDNRIRAFRRTKMITALLAQGMNALCQSHGKHSKSIKQSTEHGNGRIRSTSSTTTSSSSSTSSKNSRNSAVYLTYSSSLASFSGRSHKNVMLTKASISNEEETNDDERKKKKKNDEAEEFDKMLAKKLIKSNPSKERKQNILLRTLTAVAITCAAIIPQISERPPTPVMTVGRTSTLVVGATKSVLEDQKTKKSESEKKKLAWYTGSINL